MTIKEILQGTVDLIRDRKHWVQGIPARDSLGFCVPANDDSAVQWCITGAIMKMAETEDECASTCNFLRKYTGDYISDFNDTHSHEEVITTLEKAIADA